MSVWRATIEVWPHSTGNGREADQAACGPRRREITFNAESARDALRLAELVSEGIRTNPMVWQAPVSKLEHVHA
jgi:hypothetical protein